MPRLTARGRELRDHVEATGVEVQAVPPAPSGPPAELVIRRASQIVSRAVSWLWRDRLPLGMLVEINGDPGLGKGTIVADLTARATRGIAFPGDPVAGPPCNVLWLSAEDGADTATKPRLEAAGADLDRVYILDHVQVGDRRMPLVLPDRLDLIRQTIIERNIEFLVLDPLNGFVSSRLDRHVDADLRANLLYPLKTLAETTGTLILLIRHLNKGTGAKAVYRPGQHRRDRGRAGVARGRG